MEILNLILHIDQYLVTAFNTFGSWTYIMLFAIIFTETGLIIVPFLPGDSLLFATGALASGGFINLWAAYLIILLAAILGDTINYWTGYKLGNKVFSNQDSRLFKKAYFEKAQIFYQKYGGKTIILARFVPIIRTFAPFVAGVGKMHYPKFFLYNVIGGFAWVTSLTFAGYFFGGLPWVKANFEYVVLGIILTSFVPMIIEYIKYRYEN